MPLLPPEIGSECVTKLLNVIENEESTVESVNASIESLHHLPLTGNKEIVDKVVGRLLQKEVRECGCFFISNMSIEEEGVSKVVEKLCEILENGGESLEEEGMSLLCKLSRGEGVRERFGERLEKVKFEGEGRACKILRERFGGG